MHVSVIFYDTAQIIKTVDAHQCGPWKTSDMCTKRISCRHLCFNDHSPSDPRLEWQRIEINGESTSMVWPTLGARKAKEQNRTEPRLASSLWFSNSTCSGRVLFPSPNQQHQALSGTQNYWSQSGKVTHWPHRFLMHHRTPAGRGTAPYMLALWPQYPSTAEGQKPSASRWQLWGTLWWGKWHQTHGIALSKEWHGII